MPATLKLETIAADGRTEIARLESGSVTIGRDTDNNLVVDSDSVSRRHACIAEAGSEWIFRDLGSTNGSWLNNVKVSEDQVRVLRNNDVLQLADLLLAVTEEDRTEDPSICVMVFAGGQYQAEFGLASVGSKFTIGPQGDFVVPGREDLRCVVRREPGIVELQVAADGSQVLVNGMAVGGIVLLSDRDEIDLGDYKLVISNRLTHSAGEQSYLRRLNPAPSSPPTYGRDEVPEHMRAGDEDGEWESEASRRRTQSGRKFVFGTPVSGEIDPSATVTVDTADFPGRPGFEMNASLRFATSQPEEPRGVNEKVLILVGVTITLLMCLVVGYLVYTL